MTPRHGGWLLALLLMVAPPAWARTLTDAAGRSVEVPDRWAGHALYPAAYPDDLKAEAQDFYRRFYRVELSDRQLDALLP